MVHATAKYLRSHIKELITTVEKGEEVIISYRGRDKIKLTPLINKKSSSKKDPLFGIWKDNLATEDVDSYINKIRIYINRIRIA